MTSPLSSSDLAAIEARAEAALDAEDGVEIWVAYNDLSQDFCAEEAHFICAASPQTVLRLIAEIKRLKGEANG